MPRGQPAVRRRPSSGDPACSDRFESSKVRRKRPAGPAGAFAGGWAAPAGSGMVADIAVRRHAVQNGTSRPKGAAQDRALFTAQCRAGSHRGIQDSELLRQRFFQFRAVPVFGGRRPGLETAQIGFEDGSRGLAVIFHAPETARDHLDALRRRVEKRGFPPIHGLPPRHGVGPDSQTLEQFRRDRSARAVVRKAPQQGADRVARLQRGLDRLVRHRSGGHSPERIEKGLQSVGHPEQQLQRMTGYEGGAFDVSQQQARVALYAVDTPKEGVEVVPRRRICFPTQARPFRFPPGGLRTPPRTARTPPPARNQAGPQPPA